MTIRSLLNKMQTRKTLFLQLLFVALSFALMAISSSLFVRKMLKYQIINQAENILTKTEFEIESWFVECQTTLTVLSNTIRGMILRGDSVEMIQDYMTGIGVEMGNKTDGFRFDGIYGYFDVFGGKFIHSEGWEAGTDFNPMERPWYKAAIEAEGKIAITPMYLSIRVNDYLVTYVQRILDINGKPLGIICLEAPLDNVRNYVADMRITKNGYGILLNEYMIIVAHPNEELIGLPLRYINDGFSKLADEFESGSDVFERELENYIGEWSVTFSSRCNNGWILTTITPKAEYYRGLRDMELIIGILGAVFAVVLIVILIRIDIARREADEQNRRKGILLEEMEKMREEDERTQIMLDSTPLGVNFWNKEIKNIACNEECVRMFDLKSKQEYLDRFYDLSPEYQPCGKTSREKSAELVRKTLEEGYSRSEWMHQKLNGESVPCEVTLVRVKYKNEYSVMVYLRDLREYREMMGKIEQRDKLLNTVNHAAVVLLATDDEGGIGSSIVKGMELMGRCVDVDRVQIWQNEMIDDALHFVHKYQWISEAGMSREPVPIGLQFPYSEKPEWEKKFLRGEYINAPFRELPDDDKEFLSIYGIKSIVIIPLFFQDQFWGFFSLDDCRRERTFSEDEINILRSGGLLIANAFLRNSMTMNIRTAAVRLETALKEAQDANMAKSKFLATMSHEIRTPMNVILGVTESQLLAKPSSPETKEAFEKIFDSGNMLLHIINDILDLSKIEAGKFDLNPAKYEILSLINDTANMSVMQFGHKQIGFKLQVDKNIPSQLFGDELRIKQILNNLLSNAFKYTNTGEVALSFNVDNTDHEENKTNLIIRVRDTGQGMTKEQVSRLFDEYSRFNLEANRTTIGTGLGMAITKNLLKFMNGTMTVDSEPGRGTTFTVTIPQTICAGSLLGKEASENLQKFNITNTLRERKTKIVRVPMPYGKVLIVDDFKSNLDVAKLLLKPYELKIDTAESGFEAIDIISGGNEYDIIYMDHMMPKMDGIETTRKLRQAGYAHPIVALTANAVAGQQKMFLSNGFDGYITKPIDIRQLNDSLNKFIRDKKRDKQIPGASYKENNA